MSEKYLSFFAQKRMVLVSTKFASNFYVSKKRSNVGHKLKSCPDKKSIYFLPGTRKRFSIFNEIVGIYLPRTLMGADGEGEGGGEKSLSPENVWLRFNRFGQTSKPVVRKLA